MSAQHARIEAAAKEAERVCKKQKSCAQRTSEVLDSLFAELQSAQRLLQTGAAGTAPLRTLLQRLDKLEADKVVLDQTKELHTAVSKLGKACWQARAGFATASLLPERSCPAGCG